MTSDEAVTRMQRFVMKRAEAMDDAELKRLWNRVQTVADELSSMLRVREYPRQEELKLIPPAAAER